MLSGNKLGVTGLSGTPFYAIRKIAVHAATSLSLTKPWTISSPCSKKSWRSFALTRLQQTLKDLAHAYKDAFNKKQPKKRMPRVKRKHACRNSFRYPAGVKVESNRVFLPKLGWFKFRQSRDIIGKIKNTTVSYHGGHWHISFQTEYTRPERPHQSTSMVGVDLGVKRLATLSSGHYVSGLDNLRNAQGKLAKLQRKLAKKVKQKSGLNKSILDLGWSMLIDFYKYKQAWKNGEVLLVSAPDTSQTCSHCGYRHNENHQTQATFHCQSCGHKQNADDNASHNIEAAGHAVLADEGAALAAPVKQEPVLSSTPLLFN